MFSKNIKIKKTRRKCFSRRPVSWRVRGTSQPELGEPLDAFEDDRLVPIAVVVVRRDDDEAAVQDLADVPRERALDESAEAQPALERTVGRAPPRDHLQQDDAVAVDVARRRDFQTHPIFCDEM